MTSTSFTTSKADLPALLNNVARRFAAIATDIDIRLSGSNVVVVVVWPNDTTDPGDPGPDPLVATLGDSLSQVTDHLLNEQNRTAALFAERIDLQSQRTELVDENAALSQAKANAESLLTNANNEKTQLERMLVAKQKEIDDLKGAKP